MEEVKRNNGDAQKNDGENKTENKLNALKNLPANLKIIEARAALARTVNEIQRTLALDDVTLAVALDSVRARLSDVVADALGDTCASLAIESSESRSEAVENVPPTSVGSED